MKSPLSRQTKDIYAFLLEEGPMTAEQIGKGLRIFPHAVYRSTQLLQNMGCINQIGSHPKLFQAVPVADSVETYMLLQRDLFLNMFQADPLLKHGAVPKDINMCFIESREMLFEKALVDIENAHEEMDNVASGDELPAEIMLAQKKALERGVTIKTLFQKRNAENESYIKARTKMGEQIRVSELLNSRIVIFDKRVVYIMSYDPANYIKSIGFRFEYAPLGQLMYSLFLQYWERGTEL